MAQPRLLVLLIIASIQLLVVAQNQQKVSPKVITGSGNEQCPLQEERRAAIEEINNGVLDNLQLQLQCGAGMWYRVAYLNMSNPTEQCPSAWREYNTGTSPGARACGRPSTFGQSCPANSYTTGRLYSKVCGRIIGYQVASPDAFLPDGGIDQVYADGVSITHGQPRTHIWSYVGGYTDFLSAHNTCPCTYSGLGATQPPEFVGDNYYCESANQEENIFAGKLFSTDKLWDGQQCKHEGTCCATNMSLPWFSVELPNPTNDSIEVRICGDERTDNEDTPIELLEIYIQD